MGLSGRAQLINDFTQMYGILHNIPSGTKFAKGIFKSLSTFLYCSHDSCGGRSNIAAALSINHSTARLNNRARVRVFAFGNVFNRQSFLILLDLEIKRARRYQNCLSLLSLTFSHLVPSPGGNTSISFKTLANLVKSELRDSDIVGQGVGNRLLVMLPYADMKGTHRVRERLEKILCEYGFGREGFTVEINEVCFPTHATNFNELLQIVGNLETMCMSPNIASN